MQKSYTIFVSFIVALGGFLLGFDSAVISGAVNGITVYFSMSDWELGFSVGCVIFGAMAGNILAGPMSDRFGRKKILIVTAMLFTISALWSALATTYITFVVARIIGGIGIGGAILIAPIYIAEVSPPKLRGSLVSLNQLNIVLGISVAYFSNYFLKDLEGESWRWMLGVEAIPAVIYFFALFAVPRSPRWLIQRLNLVDIAEKILIKIGGKHYALETIEEILRGIAKKEVKGKFSDLFSNKMRTIMVIALGIAFFQQITGINAIFYYAPTIFEQAGGSTDASFLQAIVVGLTNLVFTLVAIRLIDKLGRKPLLIIGTATMAIALSMATIAFNNATYSIKDKTIDKVTNTEIKTVLTALTGESFGSQKELFAKLKPLLSEEQMFQFKRNEVKNFISINATLVLVAILLYVAAFAISLGPVMWTLLSEIFPGYIKGIAISVVGFFNSLVSYTVTQFFPWELTNLGPTLTFAIYALLAVLSLLFVLKFVIETKGKTLEEVEELLIRH
ncbi:MAG: sugar porter family MFS transporter [Flavobacteriales bacterium]|nr:sugar porter family MFS transporter [Flavobacteriia bacterium]NCP06204.1 sugar porter family MFS transporter [Flavobacteriales bacterium]PIV93804.1 MAG: MFS transporter [Flavobacteriaceae bacterium CG17_big_fil_post_rev_8_21_14_2_50_33_15]PIY09970.1 MAG: MFS transporter [Flavobacteriaceae bacterium CG_4_10_14_3_um_filter_33_47]PJB19452.1 MAG: MFS transporter [Flavobacteriaceae bacterium CG_4_9_14_3_um_filter_33_16]